MLKNYLKIAVRNLLRHKMYSFINICGLAIGIACCILILLYINNELSYDSFHKNAKRIFRINQDLKFGATELALPVCSDMMGPILKNDYPQVEEYTRLYVYETKMVKQGNDYNKEQKVAYVDSTFFRVFTFDVISGKLGKNNIILNEPNTVIISESMALKYFGTANAAGRLLETSDNGGSVYKVVAVIKDMPDNSHFRFDFLFSMKNVSYNNWGNYVSANFHTYLLLKEGVDYKEFDKKLEEYNIKYSFPYAQKYLQIQSKEDFERAGNKLNNSLVPITDIHLYSKRVQEISPSGTIQYVYIFSAVALFILFIACINFMNLTTARSANRAREVGIRKVLGTEKKNLIFQFLTESTLMSFLSVIIAVIFVFYALKYFNDLSGKNFTITDLFSGSILALLFLLPFVIGITAGSYPAFFLSRFMPSEIMKGKLSKGSKHGKLRSALVVFQFTTSIILISGTIIIYSQLNYIQSKDLGYQKDQLLVIDNTYVLGNNVDAFKDEMMKVPGVLSGTVSGFLPIPSQRNFSAFTTEPSTVEKGGMTMQRWEIDYDYLKTLGIKLIKGRNFSREFGTDSSAIILNEKAVKQLGYANPIDDKIYTWVDGGRFVSYNIIGVVKDFNFESLHQEIGSLGFVLQRSTGNCSFKVTAGKIPAILREAENTWKSFSTGMPFSYSFMDESFNEIYKAERRIGVLALSFSVLAILVACLGLFGLAAFMAEQRTKEIGIRKVLGASVPTILIMLSKEFLKWVVIANIAALPVAYYFMNKWLQDFAYRIDISWWVFIVSGVIALLIALATVSLQAIKAAVADPVKSLKYE
jgi:putative ABC transport system permease protein